MIRAIVKQSQSLAFWQFFGMILLAEAVTILVAWLLLGHNTKEWIADKAAQAAKISASVASGNDWLAFDRAPKDVDSALFKRLTKKLGQISDREFPRKSGSVYLVRVDRGEAWEIDSDDVPPMGDMGKANPVELTAYATKSPTRASDPIVDDYGTYLAAYTPILKNGRVIGLLAAAYDTAPLSDFQAVVDRTFWLSIVPGILTSLLVAYLLASMFVKPMQVFRAISEEATTERNQQSGAAPDPWAGLTPREKEVADLVGDGLTNLEMAEKLSVSIETIKTHVRRILEKTGCTGRVQIAVQASVRRRTLASV
jgi:DNA-binding CsgD family transcriptional regulator